MDRQLLEAPFPPEAIKSRLGQNGRALDYLEGHSVIARLNEAFGAEWSFDVVEHRIHHDEVVVLGELSAEGVVKTQFGSSRITRSRQDDEPVSIGDDFKSAATDALKKAATLFGVGLYLYDRDGRRNGVLHANGGSPHPSTNGSTPHRRGDNHVHDDRVTGRQIGKLFGLARDLGIAQRDVRSLAQERFDKVVDDLSRSEGSALIDELLDRLEEEATNRASSR